MHECLCEASKDADSSIQLKANGLLEKIENSKIIYLLCLINLISNKMQQIILVLQHFRLNRYQALEKISILIEIIKKSHSCHREVYEMASNLALTKQQNHKT